jgi:hypothetical protein
MNFACKFIKYKKIEAKNKAIYDTPDRKRDA